MTGSAVTRRDGQAIEAGRQPLVDVEHTSREGVRLLRPEEPPVVLHRAPHPAALTRIGASPASTAPTRVAQAGGLVVQAGMDVEGAAAGARRPWDGERCSDGVHRRGGVAMRLAHPGIHHAAGEQPHVVARRGERTATAQREPAEPGTRRHQPQSLRQRQHGRPGEQRTVVAEHGQPSPQPARRGAVLGGERRSASIPSGGRTARRSGTPARSRGTARTSP